jgi:hypothetical protein
MVEGRWNWDEVFHYLVNKCNENAGYYKLSIEEGALFKEGTIGKGWGAYNFRRNVIPRYQERYPSYEFGVSDDRKYLWCKK